ncbi:hypothetical protein ACWCPT_29615 [Streptomyces sp. NPDC002308]
MTAPAPSPNGCHHCGVEKDTHMGPWVPPVGWQWGKPTGWHQWERPTNAQILARMRARRANRAPRPVTIRDRMRTVHAAAYGMEDPICATCHRTDCPRYWRLHDRIDQQRAAARRALPVDDRYDEPPW